MNRFDIIAINTIGIALVLLWVSYFINNFIEALFVSFLVFVVIKTLTLHFLNRFRIKKNISVWELSQTLSIMGIEKVCELLLSTVPTVFNPTIDNNCILFERHNKKVLVYPNFKFAAVSGDELVKIWRFAKEKEVDTILSLARLHQRSVILLAQSLDLEFKFPSAKKLHKFLINHNAMPIKNFNHKKTKTKINIRESLSNIFIKKRAKLFLFSGLSLALFSIFTPLTIYYLVMATISLGMSVACIVVNN